MSNDLLEPRGKNRNYFAARGRDLVYLVPLVYLVCLVCRTRETRQTRAPDRLPLAPIDTSLSSEENAEH